MANTLLELLLEKRLDALGIKFSQRVYGDEIVTASRVDDTFGEDKVESALSYNVLLDRHIKGLFSESQGFVELDFVPLYQRHCTTNDGLKLTYNCFSNNPEHYRVKKNRIDNYKPLVDDLSKQGKLAMNIELDLEDTGEWGSILISGDHIDEVDLSCMKIKKDLKIKHLTDGELFSPQIVCEAVMDLLENYHN